MNRVLLSAIAVMIVAAACGRLEAVHFKHPGTGKTVQCGPYTGFTGYTYSGGVIMQRGCVEDYRAQGYLRVPPPSIR